MTSLQSPTAGARRVARRSCKVVGRELVAQLSQWATAHLTIATIT